MPSLKLFLVLGKPTQCYFNHSFGKRFGILFIFFVRLWHNVFLVSSERKWELSALGIYPEELFPALGLSLTIIYLLY
jgi:hypothetical protein